MSIDQLQALEAKATPGPWRLSKDGNIVQTAHVTRDVWIIPKSDGDMACIAAMRNALPALLEVAKAAKAVLESGQETESEAYGVDAFLASVVRARELAAAIKKLEETK